METKTDGYNCHAYKTAVIKADTSTKKIEVNLAYWRLSVLTFENDTEGD